MDKTSKQNSMRVLITGGHLSPAVAVIECMQNKYPDWQIYFTGRTHTFRGDTVVSEEERVMNTLHVRFLPIQAVRSTEFSVFSGFIAGAILVKSVIQSIIRLRKIHPHVVLTFGGYVAVPIAVAAYFLRIPIVTHEQTFTSGKANRFISLLARNVYVVDTSVARYFPKNKVVFTGLPIRSSILSPPSQIQNTTLNSSNFIYILGGTTGSMFINELIYQIVPELTDTFDVVHQVGRKWEEHALAFKNTLSKEKQKRYHVYSYIDSDDHAWYLHHCRVVIARSGANTVFELGVVGRPSVLIPLPWSSKEEQQKNAEFLSDYGTAIVLPQEKATSQTLLEAIQSVLSLDTANVKTEKHPSISRSIHAAESVVEQIQKLIS